MNSRSMCSVSPGFIFGEIVSDIGTKSDLRENIFATVEDRCLKVFRAHQSVIRITTRRLIIRSPLGSGALEKGGDSIIVGDLRIKEVRGTLGRYGAECTPDAFYPSFIARLDVSFAA